MIKITKHVDYGIVLLSCFVSKEGDAIFNARDLAGMTRLPLPMVSKILKVLARNGFLESQRGVKGGYFLTRDVGEISVLDVIQALDGPVFITQCADHRGEECAIECHCPVSGRWRKINDAIVSAMRGITLQDMIQTKAPQPIGFQEPAPAIGQEGLPKQRDLQSSRP